MTKDLPVIVQQRSEKLLACRASLKALMTSAAFVAVAFQAAPASADNTLITTGTVGSGNVPTLGSLLSTVPTTDVVIAGQGAVVQGPNSTVIGVNANAFGVDADNG